MLKWLWISVVVIFTDQLTKWMAEANLDLGQPVAIIKHLNFTLAYNTGAAFSFLSDQGGWQRWFFIILTIVVSIVILVWLKKLREHETLTAIGLVLILGGGIGNLIDRVLQGKVIDFIDVYADFDFFFLNNGHFSIFNVADIAISLGAVLLIIISFFFDENKERDIKADKVI